VKDRGLNTAQKAEEIIEKIENGLIHFFVVIGLKPKNMKR
jgi:hypothetical protein